MCGVQVRHEAAVVCTISGGGSFSLSLILEFNDTESASGGLASFLSLSLHCKTTQPDMRHAVVRNESKGKSATATHYEKFFSA